MDMQLAKLHATVPVGRRKHGETEDDDHSTQHGGGGTSSGGGGNGGGPGPGSQTPSPTNSPPKTTTVTATATTTRTSVSFIPQPAAGNNGSPSNNPNPSITPGNTQTPPTATQTGAQPGDTPIKTAPTTNNQDTTSPETPMPAPGSQSSGAPASPSSSSSSSGSPSAVVFVLNTPANTTVCDSVLLSWSYVGQSPVLLTLAVQGQNSPFANSAVSSATASVSALPPRILSTNVSSSAAQFRWSPVDVREGWYNARAYDTAQTLDISASSSSFFVAQGSDTSCLLTLTPTLSPTPGSPAPASSSRIPVGDIVGIVLGVLAGVLGLVTAFVLPRMRKRNQESDKHLLDSPKIITKKERPRLLY